MRLTPTHIIALVAAAVYVIDQATKLAVLRLLDLAEHHVVIDGFFKFVHWGNTGAAWSLFYGNNGLLALVSLGALLVLFLTRHRYDTQVWMGQLAFGLIFGGILGNLTDRIRIGHVVDFIRFYLVQRGGDEVGFPAFNIADSAICIGVGLLFLMSWRAENEAGAPARPVPTP
ncbi:MAG TPA: signal peptidase II [Candidatus Paceibacterota bacterium]|nr:signal peptidase II [Candidatus Paceibacterota bacterium]